MAKKMKNTGKGKYLVRLMANVCESSSRKSKAIVKKIGRDVVVLTQRMPRSSKRVERIIPRKDFLQLSFNKETGDVEFLLKPHRAEVFSAIGEVEIKGDTVIITDDDTGMTSYLPLEDCIIEAADDGGEGGKKSKKDKKADKKGKKGKKSKKDEDDDDDDSESDEDEDDSDDDEDSDSDDEDDDSEDDDDSESDEDEDDSDEDDDSDSDEDDDDEEDSKPRKGKGRKGGRK